ncbi:MAG: glycosyl hydrolase, partial [Lentisphaeria bacterium]
TDFHSVFMDEPAPGGVFPWTGKFAEEFTAEHAYDIIEKLPHLAVDIDETSPMIRHDYRMTQMRLQCTNYLQQVQNWCHKHNIQSAGHLSRTEFISFVLNLWPNELRCCKDLDIPCTDPLGAGIAWRDAAAYHFGLKVVSSAAHIFGKKQAGSDALAVMGNETSLRDLKFSLDYQMVLGINFFNLHGLSYSFDGPRKDEVPPSLFYQHSQWKYMPALIEHAKKTCAALSTGEHICGIAMLYPSSSFNCKFNAKQTWDASKLERKIHLLADDLLSHQKDFDLIDEITLAEHPDGKMPENWQVIILPFLKFICAETTGVLEKFRARGGRVIVLGEIPQLLGTKLEKPLTQWDAPAEIFNSELTPEILSSLPGPELNGGGKENIFILRRDDQDKIISFLFNRAEKDFTGTYNNQAVKISAKGSLLLNGESTPDSKCLSRSETLDLSSGWQVKFPNNHIPLAIWQARNDPNSPSFKAYNLLDRQKNPLDSGENKVSYQSRFLYCGKTDTLKVVFDRSAMKGNWKLLFNDVEIKEFKNERVYDCYNFSADLTKYIRTGSTPSENIITIRTEGPERGLFEIPHLYGNFSCQYRHAYRSLPFLQGGNKPLQLKSLLPWQELGYPAFSGSAQYSIDIDITTAGKYQIDFGCVEDIADVFVDKNHIELLPWKPYGCMLGFLKEGKHTLTVDITNGPGNHDRLAMLTAGLLGPVTLYKLL